MTALAETTASGFTPEQRAAIEDRDGSALLAAAAGSGKTAVMVERFVEAVLRDGVAVGSVLALTFTEKAAGELRERLRRRLTALGEIERAREAEAAWIGTIHGFCARVLRARPLAAGLDPRFTVLDEAAARRLAERAYETALEAWAAAGGAAALDLAAAYGPALRDLILAAHETLRSRGQTHPRLTVPPPQAPPDPAALDAARATAAAALATAADGKKVAAAREALDACERFAAAGPVPWPGELDVAKLVSGAKALEDDACADYREAWETYRKACADHHARAALALLDDLLDRFGTAFDAAKAARAAVDFADLELRVRDLLADPAARVAWAERFELIMVDEFQDTNRLQLDVLEALERDNLFAVGDELQSIYRFRHADVTIFRERRARLGEDRVRRLSRNFRSREELLDVLNAAFTAELGDSFAPLVAGAAVRRRAAAAVRPRPGARRPRGRAADHRHARLGGARARPHRLRHAAVAARRGAADRAPAARRGRRRPPARRHRRARPRHRLAAAARAGARGAGPADLRGRRPRLLVAGAGPRRHRLPLRARQPARRAGAAGRARLAVLRGRHGRAGAADRGGPGERPRRPCGAARGRDRGLAGGAARRRARAARGLRPRASPPSARAPSARPPRSCSSGRSSPPATTSRCWPAPAASGGWRTCAS